MGTESKVAVITGASQGIGAALVKAYRDRNYRVIANSRSIKPSKDSDVLTIAGDVADPKTGTDYASSMCSFELTPGMNGALGTGQLATKTVGGSSAIGGGTAETELDIETALSLAPKANIEVYEAPNNDAGGKAVVNALQLAEILGDDRRMAPADLIAQFPAALGEFHSNRPVQNALFASGASEHRAVA